MTTFTTSTSKFCGVCCGSRFSSKLIMGIGLRFDQPWEYGEEGRKVVTIETSEGPIFIKLNLDNCYHDLTCPTGAHNKQIDPLGPDFPDDHSNRKVNNGIQHYTCKEIEDGKYDAQVGLVIAADNYAEYDAQAKLYLEKGFTSQAKVYRDYAELHKDSGVKVRNHLKEKGILLYESPRFYNLTHTTRNYPSLTFFVYDKALLTK